MNNSNNNKRQRKDTIFLLDVLWQVLTEWEEWTPQHLQLPGFPAVTQS